MSTVLKTEVIKETQFQTIIEMMKQDQEESQKINFKMMEEKIESRVASKIDAAEVRKVMSTKLEILDF
jgi:hypothetical protein